MSGIIILATSVKETEHKLCDSQLSIAIANTRDNQFIKRKGLVKFSFRSSNPYSVVFVAWGSC
jgi:hypothetical protein